MTSLLRLDSPGATGPAGGAIGAALHDDFLRRLVSAGTIGAAAQAAVDTVREVLGADVSWSGVANDGEFLTMAAYSGLRTVEMTALWRLQVGHGVGGRVAKEGRTIAVRDYRRDPRRVPVMKQFIDHEGIRSAICAPFVSGAEVLGVLYAADRSTRDWTVEEIRLATSVAHDTGLAIARIRGQDRDRESARENELSAQEATRSLEVVRAITDTLAQTEDVGAGIDTIAHHLRMHVELLDLRGDVLRTAPPGSAHGEQVRLEGDVGDEPLGTLRIRGDRELTKAEEELVDLCSHLIALQLLRERAALQTELRLHSEFLEDLLDGRLDDRHGMCARAALLGVDLKSARYVVCLGLPVDQEGAGDDTPAVTRRVFNQVEQAIDRRFPRSIVIPRGGDVVVLLDPGDADLKRVRRMLRDVARERTGPAGGLAAGLGRMCADLDDYEESYAEASLALDLARRRIVPGEVLSPADLGFYGLLGRGSTRQSLESMVEGTLGPILAADAAGSSEYVKTLYEYLSSDRHLKRTAARLHVHPNTVRYRVAKAQEVLGVSLRDVDDRFRLELALRVQAALESR